MAAPLASIASAPLYERIKTLILTQIASGGWAAAQRIPSENDLVRLVGASRMTVNRALRELTDAGYLVRVQGVGTFVADRRAQGHPLAIRNIADEILERGHAHSARIVILERRSATAELAVQFDLAAGHELFHSRLVHFENSVTDPARRPLRESARGARLSRTGFFGDHPECLSHPGRPAAAHRAHRTGDGHRCSHGAAVADGRRGTLSGPAPTHLDARRGRQQRHLVASGLAI